MTKTFTSAKEIAEWMDDKSYPLIIYYKDSIAKNALVSFEKELKDVASQINASDFSSKKTPVGIKLILRVASKGSRDSR